MKQKLKNFILLCSFCSMLNLISQAQKTDTLFIYFKQNSFSLDKKSKTILDNLADSSYRFSAIKVNGRSSEEGSEEYNKTLAKRRADAIVNLLIKKNFNGDIQKHVLGEDQQIGSAGNRSLNRSVELILTLNPPDDAMMQKFLSSNYPTASIYDYSSAKGLKITSDDTYISIPNNAFAYPDGRVVSGKVEVRISKIRSIREILKSGLHTNSDHGPLQTAGMFEVKAFKNKQELRLRKGNVISLKVSSDSIYDDMSTFGLYDSTQTWYESKAFKLSPVNYTFNYSLFFKDQLTPSEKSEMNRNIQMMKGERRNFLNVLLGAFIKENREDKINRLISLFNLQSINIIFDNSANWSNGISLFEDKTQRKLKMNDDQFKDINFKQVSAVSTTLQYEASEWTVLPDLINMDGASLKYYDVKIPNLQILNIDRLLKFPRLDNLIVDNGEITNAKIHLIFPELNCVLPGNSLDTCNLFKNVPKNKEAIIFAFGIKKGAWYYAKKKITTVNQREELIWIKSDENSIKNEMENI